MFGWFQRLLPKLGDFFGMFEAHAATLSAAADALPRLAGDAARPRSTSGSSRIASMSRTTSSVTS